MVTPPAGKITHFAIFEKASKCSTSLTESDADVSRRNRFDFVLAAGEDAHFRLIAICRKRITMSLSIQCPSCGAQYQVGDDTQGKRVRCKQCQQVFSALVAAPVAAAPLSPLGASSPLDPLGGVDLSQFPTLPAATAPRFSPLPSQPAWANSGGPTGPPEGPTDMQMRLVSGGMLGLGVILAVGSVIMHANTGTVYLMAVALIPLSLVLGIAGLISPNVVRACGKYGGHLPWQYKVIGWGLMGLSFVLMALLMIALFSGGFKPG